MNELEFKTLQQNVSSVFAVLYLIDVDTLSTEQRKLHQQALSAAYLALVNAENTHFTQLTVPAKAQLAVLAQHVQRLQQAVSAAPAPHETLLLVAEDLSALARVAQLL